MNARLVVGVDVAMPTPTPTPVPTSTSTSTSALALRHASQPYAAPAQHALYVVEAAFSAYKPLVAAPAAPGLARCFLLELARGFLFAAREEVVSVRVRRAGPGGHG